MIPGARVERQGPIQMAFFDITTKAFGSIQGAQGQQK